MSDEDADLKSGTMARRIFLGIPNNNKTDEAKEADSPILSSKILQNTGCMTPKKETWDIYSSTGTHQILCMNSKCGLMTFQIVKIFIDS